MADTLDQMFPAEQEAEIPAEPVVETVPEPAETPEVTPEPVVEPQRPEAGYVPIGTVLDEREKRKALEQELNALKQQQAPKAAVPDPYDDPQGFQAYYADQLAQVRQTQKIETSYHLAARDYGKEQVEAAREWAVSKAQSDPVFGQQLEAAFQVEALPLDWVVQQHKRDALLSDIGDNMDDWFTREAAKRGYQLQSAPVPAAASAVVIQQPASKPAMPPRSIASEATPSAPTRDSNPMADLDAIFSRR